MKVHSTLRMFFKEGEKSYREKPNFIAIPRSIIVTLNLSKTEANVRESEKGEICSIFYEIKFPKNRRTKNTYMPLAVGDWRGD